MGLRFAALRAAGAPLLIIVRRRRRRRRRRRAVAPTSNTASHDYHEKISWRVSIGMGLRLAALRAAGAPLKKVNLPSWGNIS